jgi:hypothetical protein
MTAFPISLRTIGAATLVGLAFFVGRWTASTAASAHTTSAVVQPSASPGAASVTPLAADVRLRALAARRPGNLAAEEDRKKWIEQWAETDPRAALEFARTQLKGDRQTEAMSAALSVWGRNDPAGAWNWVKTEMPAATYHFDTLLEVFGRQSTETAALYATQFSTEHPDAALEVHLAALMGVTYRGDFAGARALVDGDAALDPTVRANLNNFIAGQWARFAPQDAAAWVMSLPAGAQRDQALTGLGESWSEADPAQATQFAAALPAGDARTLAMRQAVSKWVESDPAAARAWMLQTDRQDDFDQAVSSIATQNNFMSREPAQAMHWAEGIFDDGVRAQSESAILFNWFPTDPAAATAYLQSSPDFTPEQRAEMLRKLRPSPTS